MFVSNSILGGTTPTVTDSRGNIWTLVAGGQGVVGSAPGGTTPFYGTFVAPNCAAGANNVTVSTSGLADSDYMLALHEYSGVPTSSPVDVSQAVNNISASTLTPSVTTTGTNSTLHLMGATILINLAVAAPVGYLAYLFDGNGSIEKGTFKTTGRGLNDTPNTVAFPFQDSANGWVQDSVTTIDPFGYVSSGNQEIEAPLQVLGIENFDQGTRRSNIELAKALYGNSRFDAGGTEFPTFRTTVKAAHLASRVGFICGIKYAQLGL
jgi:hypothetical protein